MKNFEKVDAKIRDYKKNPSPYALGEKRLGLTTKQIAEWFKAIRPDAKVDVMQWDEVKRGLSGRNNLHTYGGSRTYKGYRVIIKVDGCEFDHESTQTYRTSRDLLWDLLNHLK